MFKNQQQLLQEYAQLKSFPKQLGTVELLVCRPDRDKRQVIDEAVLNRDTGLEGDNWLAKGSRHTPDSRADPNMQITLMNAKVIGLIAGAKSNWPLAGDQLFVDFDLSESNVPVGTRLQVGTVVLEVTAEPHLGCLKFSKRYGKDAMEFVNSELGKRNNLRGVNAKIVEPGVVRVDDQITKLN